MAKNGIINKRGVPSIRNLRVFDVEKNTLILNATTKDILFSERFEEALV